VNNDLSLDVLVTHLRARRNALFSELRDAEKRVAEINGAIEETRIIEQQAANGMMAKSRLSCE